MELDIIDGSPPLITCKDGNLRIFMEPKKKNGHFKDIQLGDLFEVRLAVLLMCQKRLWCQMF